jgi:replicative DNA helicase
MSPNTRKTKAMPATYPDFGKIQPQAIDMEEAVLGAIMLEKDALLIVIEILKPEYFYREAHQKIFSSIVELTKRNSPADLFSVSEELRAHNELDSIGGPMYVTTLTSKVVSAANVEYHASIVAQKFFQREMIRIGTDILTKAFDDTYDIADLLESAELTLLEISGRVARKKPMRLGIIVDQVLDEISKIKAGELKIIGVPSGLVALDRCTGGLRKQELTIVAARPSMGKTSYCLQIGMNAARMGYPVAFFSLEMGNSDLARRCISGSSGKSNIDLLNGNCDLDHLCKATEELVSMPLYIDETSSISIVELRAKIRRLILEHGIKLVIIDYLQLMSGTGDSREQEVASISRGLKAIAKDFDIPVMAAAQLNRKVEATGDKKPNLSDLRESGAIEQDADIVQLIYRPEKYGLSTAEICGETINTKGVFAVIIGKNRNGPVGEIKFRCTPSLSRIYEENEIQSNLRTFDEEPPFAQN